MMGTGKTTVGALVAERLARPFIDIDIEVMATTGRTVPALFDEGESVFRAAETDAIREAAGAETSVISTGGGAVLARQNLEMMRSTGTTVLLTASTDTIVARIGAGSDRPLATSQETLAAIAELRTAIYLEAADHTVATDDLGPAGVAEEVLECVATL
jgi:shikimate kinase